MTKRILIKNKPDPAILFCWAFGLAALLMGTGCSSIPVEKREGIRMDMVARADRTLDEFIERYPEVVSELQDAEGYAVGWLESGMAAVARGLGGQAVLVDNMTGSRTFLNIGKAGLGVGAGVTEFDELIIIKDRKTVEKFQRGHWRFEMASWAASGEDYNLKTREEENFSRYVIHRKGAAVTASSGFARISVNRDLTDDAVSDYSIPNTGFKRAGEQQENPPRVWPYRLPFLAQKVVDKGYDLPIPYGVSFSGVSVEQDIDITSLAVAFNGGEKVPYDFVSFENTFTDIQSVQVKVDTWIFPFLNVFAMAGKVSGEVTSDINLDGNTLLSQLGTDCYRLIPPLECILLRDKVFTLPIRVDVDTKSYGCGAVLAGGWKGFFAVIPVTVSYTKAEKSVTDGNSFTITPRIGRAFNLGNKGNLSVYFGGNRLDSDLSVTGNFDLLDLVDLTGEVTDTIEADAELILDYQIEQNNMDKWNLVAGFNWEFSRHISWSLEYNGFIGSRESWITSLSFRLF